MIQRQSQNVSLAHRPNGDTAEMGNNLRVELAVVSESLNPFVFSPYLERIKALLDHRCLDKPSSLDAVARMTAREIFQQPLSGAQWRSLTVWEMDRFGCSVEFENSAGRWIVQHRNLTLVCSSSCERKFILDQIDRVFAYMNGKLDERLFPALAAAIPGLLEVTVDLGRHRSVRLAHTPSPLR